MDALEKTTIYLPAETRRRLAEIARQRNVPQAQLIRDALHAYLAVQERSTLRSLGAGNSTTITGHTARQWLRENWKPRDHTG
jgi:predicted transcriptional regulator